MSSSSKFAGKEYTIYRGSNGDIIPVTVKIPTLGPHDILVRITHSGVCHTDVGFCHALAGLALGHEGVGVVEEVGASVTDVSVGERVGGGFLKLACGQCKYCKSGREIMCYDRVIFGHDDLDNGTFSQYYIAKESFIYKIPDNLSSEDAAPLQCAGATVYRALKNTVTPGKRVGIYGIGGLGHLAIQYAAKMGAETVVFSSSADKEEEARSFGASEFHLTDNMVETTSAPIDVLILTGTYFPDWDKAMVKEFLARDAIIVPLAAPSTGSTTINLFPMLMNCFQISPSLVASPAEHKEMLEFSAKHGIKPLVQIVKHQGVDTIKKVFGDLHNNKVRYRAVLQM